MHPDESFFSEVDELAGVLHKDKGNPLAGALDSWIQAMKIILVKKAGGSKAPEIPEVGRAV